MRLYRTPSAAPQLSTTSLQLLVTLQHSRRRRKASRIVLVLPLFIPPHSLSPGNTIAPATRGALARPPPRCSFVRDPVARQRRRWRECPGPLGEHLHTRRADQTWGIDTKYHTYHLRCAAENDEGSSRRGARVVVAPVYESRHDLPLHPLQATPLDIPHHPTTHHEPRQGSKKLLTPKSIQLCARG
jgi:hypothetical protein